MKTTCMCLLIAGVLAGGSALSAADQAASAASQSGKAAATAAVNLNTASTAQLEALPGIGPALASRIVEHREKHGPFKKIEDLMTIRGIGEKQFLKLKPLVTVVPAKSASQGGPLAPRTLATSEPR